MTLALLHALRDIGLGLLIAGLFAAGIYLVTVDDRGRIEREDLADFEHWAVEQRTPDWQWPDRPPRAEYVVKRKERTR